MQPSYRFEKRQLWLKNGARIGGAWVLAIGVLLTGLYVAQSHGTFTQSRTCSDVWVQVTNAASNTSEIVNLSSATAIIRGTFDGKDATLIWHGGDATPVVETPEALLKLLPVKTLGSKP